ncbi:helix-turn-helix domain-containing protein [Nocardia sp. NBC_00508]|uniref:helix-turn-helix domain-containing protein n=1 Tax=Nocardia sp. NBC_00508 TaxID=2975992 RepID=UPI002E8063FA|nr:helix-turn-helix domain-containing protein [Nocardia sp. NBC_00508]WUD65461.1 helix-turn-helix domain-containing protein [Nocardia sp. NBC_00508]
MSNDLGHDDGRYIGRQVRAIRARRGISQQVLADRVGVSRGAIAKYENGERPVDSRRTLHALAQALGVALGDLTGDHRDRLDPISAGFHAAVSDIETALWTHGNTTTTRAPRNLDELTATTKYAADLRRACDYATLGPLLAPLLNDCYRHTRDATGAARDRTWDALAAVAYITAQSAARRGYPSLAWTAAQEIERATENIGGTGGPAAAAYIRSQILLARPGSFAAAFDNARTVDRLAPDVRTLGEIETYGMLHLQAALVTAALGGDPTDHLDEADEQVARLEQAGPDSTLLRNPTFDAANVTLWRMSAAMERREPGQVLELAPTLAPETIAAEGRRAQYFVEIGRAHALRRDYRSSLHALLRAEHIAPQQVRGMTHVRELVGHMMRSARRDLTTGDLGRLAKRIGAVPA